MNDIERRGPKVANAILEGEIKQLRGQLDQALRFLRIVARQNEKSYRKVSDRVGRWLELMEGEGE